MKIRQFYDNVLSELNKVEAPSLLLEDFVYFANKTIQQYINKVYNRYDVNQQSTDDLRSLKTTSKITIKSNKDILLPTEEMYWYVDLPKDYLHLLNCIVVFKKQEKEDNLYKCSDSKEKDNIKSLARRLTSDMYPNIMNNAYFKPSYKNPYYFISHVTSESFSGYGFAETESINSRLEKIVYPCKSIEETINDTLEIRCGSTKKYIPEYIWIDYIKIPEQIKLEYNELEQLEDNTKELEFPEYVCYELINECVKLILENSSDPRLQTNIPINQTIGTNVSQNK